MPEMTLQQAFDLAVHHHQAGRLNEAETLYRQILAVEPRHADALHHLGMIALQVGRNDVAVDLISQVIALQPDNPAAHSNLGNALKEIGQLDEAIAAWSQAIALRPDSPAAYHNLGIALKEQGKLDQAIAAYRQAIALRPDYPEAYANLGNALRIAGQFDEAIHACRQAIALRPASSVAHNNLGLALRDQGQLDEAIAAYHQAITLQPASAVTYSNLGNALRDKGQLDEAIAAYRQAITLQPGFPDAHNNLGNALTERGFLDEAIAAYQQAIALQPGSALNFSNLANALRRKGRLDEARAACRQAITLQPDYSDAHNNLGITLTQLGQLDEAIAAFHQAITLRPAYPEAYCNLGHTLGTKGRLADALAACRQAIALKPDFSEAHSNLVLDMNYVPGLEPSAIAEEHRRWSERHAEPLRRFILPHPNDRSPQRRLRIGYVSPDFRNHPVAYFLEGLLEYHDSAQVEVFCYAEVLNPDALTARFEHLAGHWRKINGQTDTEVAELIRADGIDILVDLAGHTAHNRLLVFARKPAPVQVTWLGYSHKTGLDTMDYRLTDAFADPPESSEALPGERLVRLPRTFACFHPADPSPPVGPLPATGRGWVTFASFHILAKLNDELLECWAEILNKVRGSRLMMVATGLDEPSTRERFTTFFDRRGIAAERLEFKGRQALAAYLALHHEVDVVLDCHPFSGHTVSCHALWMGVPVVTLTGKTHCSRMVASVLSNLGLAGLVAASPAEYVALAVALAKDLPRLAELRSTLRGRMEQSPIMDAPGFARDIEAAYREMWHTWCAQPESPPCPK